MGAEYGRGLKGSGFKLPDLKEKRLRFGRDCRAHVETVFPEILDELSGIADAAGVGYDELCAMVLTDPESTAECSIFAVKDGEETWMGRNYDWFYSERDRTESYFTDPNGGFKSVGQTDVFVGREDGVNEKGLGVAMSGITAYFKPGVTFWIAIRYLLDKCATVEEGVKFLTETPPHCTITVLLADPTGEMAVVETSPMRTEVRRPEEGFIVSTNHLNHPEMQKIEMFEPPDSRTRYSTIVQELRSRSQLNERAIQAILSDHKGLVCSHRDDIGLGTLWSTVAHLSSLRVWRAEGHPCMIPYFEDSRLREAVGKTPR